MGKNLIKKTLKKNKCIDACFRIICFPIFYAKMKKNDRDAKERMNGRVDIEYEWIKELKDKYSGKRCFMVATGPSLTLEDLELIKDEYSFGMNSCILAFDKTEWRPDFYGIQDEYVYEKLEKELVAEFESGSEEIWTREGVVRQFETARRFKKFPLNHLDHKMFHLRGYGRFLFSMDCYSCIYDAYSITFSLLQFACYMGFKEIYLLGCDCNYNQEKTHFMEYGHKDPKAKIMGDKMIVAHFEFKKFADKLGVKIVNCTRGGMLEVYPREPLEDVIKRDQT